MEGRGSERRVSVRVGGRCAATLRVRTVWASNKPFEARPCPSKPTLSDAQCCCRSRSRCDWQPLGWATSRRRRIRGASLFPCFADPLSGALAGPDNEEEEGALSQRLGCLARVGRRLACRHTHTRTVQGCSCLSHPLTIALPRRSRLSRRRLRGRLGCRRRSRTCLVRRERPLGAVHAARRRPRRSAPSTPLTTHPAQWGTTWASA